MFLTTIHEWDNANIKWNRNTWLTHLKEADIIVIPADLSRPAKSNNRLTQSMSLGKSIICSPLPSYLDVAEKFPGTFLIAATPEEWREKLRLLRDDKTFREELGKKAQAAAQNYSLDAIGGKWIDALINKDLVDIVIPTYKNLRGIQHCIESIRVCTRIPYKIIVVNNGTDEGLHQYLSGQKDIIYVKRDRMNFAEAVNTGIRAGTGKYICILNDDVIVSKGWLNKMLDVCKGHIGCVGVLSNCDKGWLHNYNLFIAGVHLLPGTNTFEEIEPIIPHIYDYQSPYNEMHIRDWVAFYCTMIPREVIEKVGLLNEDFTNTGEDVDYCRRITNQGYKIIQTFNAFVFHFGAVSRKLLEKEDPEAYQTADKKTNFHLQRLWDKKSVIVYSGPSWEKWNFRTMETSGIGGSEVWQIWITRELSKLGYRVISFCDCESEIMDGDVQWCPYTQYPRWVEQHWADYAILSRTTDPLRFPLRAGKVFVQIHDIWLLSERNQLFLDRVNKFCTLSQWHSDFASDHHGIPKDKMAIVANGIDFDRFDRINVERHPFRFHWSSSWDRGLDNVLYLWPFIKERLPEAELHCYYGVFNWKSKCLQDGNQAGLKQIEALEEGIKQPGVYTHGRVNQQELAEGIKRSSLWLYPTAFTETFCISSIECQRAGVPVLCHRFAGLTTTLVHPTLGDTALMLGHNDSMWPYTKEGREKFLEEAISILTDKTKWQHWSDIGFENSKRFSWANVAQMWKDLFEQ
jgi:GT2 family glycosyltransferase